MARQRARITPKLAVLRGAFEERRLRLQDVAPTENPELVLVLETIGSVDRFANAVRKVEGLEWLVEWTEDQVEPDEDFYVTGKPDIQLSGRLFLLGSNEQALNQLLGLWDRYQSAPSVKFDRGLTPFRNVFQLLKDIRPWGLEDRVGTDVRLYWEDTLASGAQDVHFEIETWFYSSPEKNEAVGSELGTRITALDGRILRRILIPEIDYHGFLVTLPREAIARILAGETPALLLNDRIMFFRPKGQSMAVGSEQSELGVAEAPVAVGNGAPVVALLDGLPMQNHALLAGRLIVDDPDGWEATYEAKDRVHGTAMASLILHGDIGGGEGALARRLYVRPVLKPDPTDFVHERRSERTPTDVLLLDLMHRAVRRLFEGDGAEPHAVAPSVRVINLSVGDASRMFDREVSPWARLLDWLACKYQVLFVVSAGNCAEPLTLDAEPNTLGTLQPDNRTQLALGALLESGIERRLLAPAESINALTIGAVHSDQSQAMPVPNRYDLFAAGGVSPLSRIGHGFRRGIKPDLLLPGGRVLHRERLGGGDTGKAVVEVVQVQAAPGQRVAVPPLPGEGINATAHSRGTSNATALATRVAAQAYEVLEELRVDSGDALPREFDAVLLKALLAHGAKWGDLSAALLARRPDLTDHVAKKGFLARWLGHGTIDASGVGTCTAERATLLGVGALRDGEALVFTAPLPPSLAGKALWRRLTVTLAWLSPIYSAHQAYRRARLWVAVPGDKLLVKRSNSVYDKAAQRGTLQHEILEGEAAVAFTDGAGLECKVNCAADAGVLASEEIRFGLCLSLEVGVGVGIPLYEEVRARVAAQVAVQLASS